MKIMIKIKNEKRINKSKNTIFYKKNLNLFYF